VAQLLRPGVSGLEALRPITRGFATPCESTTLVISTFACAESRIKRRDSTGSGAACRSEAPGDGVAYLEGIEFAKQQSFLGIAFHGVDGAAYDAVHSTSGGSSGETKARRAVHLASCPPVAQDDAAGHVPLDSAQCHSFSAPHSPPVIQEKKRAASPTDGS
jgi:hypothetical protein